MPLPSPSTPHHRHFYFTFVNNCFSFLCSKHSSRFHNSNHDTKLHNNEVFPVMMFVFRMCRNPYLPYEGTKFSDRFWVENFLMEVNGRSSHVNRFITSETHLTSALFASQLFSILFDVLILAKKVEFFGFRWIVIIRTVFGVIESYFWKVIIFKIGHFRNFCISNIQHFYFHNYLIIASDHTYFWNLQTFEFRKMWKVLWNFYCFCFINE